MHETLFNHVNIKWENIHIPDGTLSRTRWTTFCAEYEQKIKAAGGIDIQILGIGRTGHIGFNEPGSPQNSRTRMVTLDSITRRDAAAVSSARRTSRTRRSRWASRASSTPARCS